MAERRNPTGTSLLCDMNRVPEEKCGLVLVLRLTPTGVNRPVPRFKRGSPLTVPNVRSMHIDRPKAADHAKAANWACTNKLATVLHCGADVASGTFPATAAALRVHRCFSW